VRVGRVPPALQAHSEIATLCDFRVESTAARDGEQARADRTCRAGAGGAPSRIPINDDWLELQVTLTDSNLRQACHQLLLGNTVGHLGQLFGYQALALGSHRG
jgi:hypothetical protein